MCDTNPPPPSLHPFKCTQPTRKSIDSANKNANAPTALAPREMRTIDTTRGGHQDVAGVRGVRTRRQEDSPQSAAQWHRSYGCNLTSVSRSFTSLLPCATHPPTTSDTCTARARPLPRSTGVHTHTPVCDALDAAVELYECARAV